jgi:hypothetical protein
MRGNLVEVASGDPFVSAYASRSGKTLSLILINKDKQTERAIAVDLKNFAPQKQAKTWILDEKRTYSRQKDLTNISTQFPLKVPPYSIMAVDVIASDSVIPPVNIARQATATASSYSTIGPHFKPESAIDGKQYTRWNSAAWTKSNGQEAQWFQLAWTEDQKIDSVRICWGESYGTAYKIMSSIDGKTWETLREVNEGHGGVETFAVGNLRTRFLKIDGSRGSKGISAYSIREIEVYEHPTAKQ